MGCPTTTDKPPSSARECIAKWGKTPTHSFTQSWPLHLSNHFTILQRKPPPKHQKRKKIRLFAYQNLSIYLSTLHFASLTSDSTNLISYGHLCADYNSINSIYLSLRREKKKVLCFSLLICLTLFYLLLELLFKEEDFPDLVSCDSSAKKCRSMFRANVCAMFAATCATPS